MIHQKKLVSASGLDVPLFVVCVTVVFFHAQDVILQRYVTGVEMCVFFFQAEDGIRDLWVTGVQTCALPINSSQAEDGIRDLYVTGVDRKSTRLNSSHVEISYAVFCLRTEEHTPELQSRRELVCRVLPEKHTPAYRGAQVHELLLFFNGGAPPELLRLSLVDPLRIERARLSPSHVEISYAVFCL